MASPRKQLNKWSRKLHRWGAIATALPILLITATGMLLQFKKQIPWIQPPTPAHSPASGQDAYPSIAFDEILAAAQTVPGADVNTWEDIDRIDVRPARGLAKVQTNSSIEIQIDLTTGEVLQSAVRRSDLIEALHDGSFFSDPVKYGVFVPSGAVLFVLWLTGLYLWLLPFLARKRKPA